MFSSRSTTPAARTAAVARAPRLVSQPSPAGFIKAVTTRTTDVSLVDAIDETVQVTGVESKCPVLRAMQVPKNPSNIWTTLGNLHKLLYNDIANTQAGWLGSNTMVESSMLGIPSYLVGNREGVIEVMRDESRFEVFTHPTISTLIGEESLIQVSGQAHKKMRDLLHPLLGPATYDKYIPAIQQLVEDLLHNAAEGSKSGPVKLAELNTTLTFEVISKLVLGFGVPQHVHDEVKQCQKDITGGLFLPMVDLPFLPFGKAKQARARLEEILDEQIANVTKEIAAGEPSSGLLADMLTSKDAAGNSLTRDQIVDNFNLMMFAGTDTTATLLHSLEYHLMKHPQYMQELIAEQARVEAKYGPNLSKQALQEMPFTECCIAEALRVKMPAGGLFRKAAEDTELLGYAVPKGTAVLMPIAFALKYDTLWKDETGDLDPQVFNPHRYKGRVERAFSFAFGNGMRRCPGYGLAMMETKVWLAVVARMYNLRFAEEAEWRGPIPHLSNGLLAYVEAK